MFSQIETRTTEISIWIRIVNGTSVSQARHHPPSRLWFLFLFFHFGHRFLLSAYCWIYMLSTLILSLLKITVSQNFSSGDGMTQNMIDIDQIWGGFTQGLDAWNELNFKPPIATSPVSMQVVCTVDNKASIKLVRDWTP